jgi:hypothetical protein
MISLGTLKHIISISNEKVHLDAYLVRELGIIAARVLGKSGLFEGERLYEIDEFEELFVENKEEFEAKMLTLI